MKKLSLTLLLGALLVVSCKPTATSTPVASSTPEIPTTIPTRTFTPTPTSTFTPTPPPQGNTIVVTSASDSGPGTLRQALLDAQPYDTITFDPGVFPPDNHVTILISTPLPWIEQGHLTIDASNAGVILDGSGIPGEDWGSGISISSEENTIQGLHIVNFNGAGIELYEADAHNNTIGGNAGQGAGPLGQGNLCTGNIYGILLGKTRDNTITGNQIGVEIDGVQGNLEFGILVQETRPGNVIGPENSIVNSGAQGVFVRDAEADGVTITRNQIYGNAIGISIYPRIATTIAAPAILSFDLDSGTVSGVACPGCEVEIFSGDGGGAEIFEGSLTATADGTFTFTSGAPFTGSSLVTTSTRTDGSTSGFSYPTMGENWSGVLQEGNVFPVQIFNALSSEEIGEDNRIGTHGYIPVCSESGDFLQHVNGMGFKRLRLAFNEMEVPYDLNFPEVPGGTDYDPCIDYFLSRGIELSYILSFWDKQAQLSGEELPCGRFANVGEGDPETERYLEFLHSVVPYLAAHGIHNYEIWDEPDNPACTQGISSQNYLNLVALVTPEIRNIDPDARIFVGAVSGTNDANSQNFLRTIVNSPLIMPLVDVVSWHPFYGPSPAYPGVAGYYNTYPAFVENIKEAATNSGFTGEFFADELTWRTPINPEPSQPWIYPEIVSAKYYARGILMHLGMDVQVGADVGTFLPVIFSTVRNLSTVMAGNTPFTHDVEIESTAGNLMYYSFALTNGDQLFAIWTNGAAVEYDPGVSTTLTFSFNEGIPDNSLGIDVLRGYSQQLNTESDENLLIIRDLRVKDYPLIIKFSNAPQ